MRVVHITPTYFADSSIIGGGERYVSELSAWMARRVPTTLVTFSSNCGMKTSGRSYNRPQPQLHPAKIP